MIEKEFADRVPTYAGRVTLVPVEGTSRTFDVIRADSPITEGTPLDKALFDSITQSRLTGRYYAPAATVDGSKMEYSLASGIPLEWSENQRIMIKTPSVDISGTVVNYLNGIQINEVLEPLRKYELVYNGSSFDVEKIAAADLDDYVKNAVSEKTKITVLWENASPNSEFAYQTITLSSDDWDFLIVAGTGDMAIVQDGDNFTLSNALPSSDQMYMSSRALQVTSKTTILFENAYQIFEYNNTMNPYKLHNACHIPKQIYGVKMGVAI